LPAGWGQAKGIVYKDATRKASRGGEGEGETEDEREHEEILLNSCKARDSEGEGEGDKGAAMFSGKSLR